MEPTEGDDPWGWDTDRVVRELCTPNRTWPDYATSQRLPDPAQFEQVLRENDITGYNLLNDLDSEHVLKEDLGIRNFNQRSTIKHAIRALRLRSTAYATYRHKYREQSSNDSSNIGNRIVHPTVDTEDGVVISPHHVPKNSLPLPSDQKITDGSVVERANEDSTSKRRRLENETNGESAFNEAVLKPNDGEFTTMPDLYCSMENSKKRKRAVLHLIGDIQDPERPREIPSAADSVVLNVPGYPGPGEIYLNDNGKKRVAPILLVDQLRADHESSALQAGGQRGLEAADAILRGVQPAKAPVKQQPLDRGYLGAQNMPAIQIFYNQLQTGSELTDIDIQGEVLGSPEGISSGRRLYVNSMMKSYFRAPIQDLVRNGKRFRAKQSYSNRLTPLHQYSSFTLFHAKQDGTICATHENISQWPEINPDIATPAAQSGPIPEDTSINNYQIDMPDILPVGGSAAYANNGWDEEMLQKYRFADGGDQILPLFGESGSEGEYDLDTWKEMEEEQGTISRPHKVSEKLGLSVDEINRAIDEGIARLVIKWNEQKKLKCQIRAWKQWYKSRKDGTLKEQLREAQRHLERLNKERLVGLRMEILNEQWTRATQVHQQTRVMEQSVFDREDRALTVEVLKRKTPPEKPIMPEAVTKKLRMQQSEAELEDEAGEGESLGSNSDDQVSNDGSEDFIVSDSMGDAVSDGHYSVDFEESVDETSGSTPSTHVTSNGDQSAAEGNGSPSSRRARKRTKMPVSSPNEGTGMPNIALSLESNVTSPVNNSEIDPARRLREILAAEDIPSIKDEFRTPNQKPALNAYSEANEVIDLISSSEPENEAGCRTPQPKVTSLSPTPTQPFKDPKRPGSFQAGGGITFKLPKQPKQESRSKLMSSKADLAGPIKEPVPFDPENLPDLYAFSVIKRIGADAWAEAVDDRRLLVALIIQMPSSVRDPLLNLLIEVRDEQTIRSTMVEVLEATILGKKSVKGVDAPTFRNYEVLTNLFACFIYCKSEYNIAKSSDKKIRKTIKKLEHFQEFYELCLNTLKRLRSARVGTGGASKAIPLNTSGRRLVSDDDEEDSEPLGSVRRLRSTHSSSENDCSSGQPRLGKGLKIRKRVVKEDKDAKRLRIDDAERNLEQALRRKNLHAKLSHDSSMMVNGQIIINDAKQEHEGFVYVHPSIAMRIKEHQIEGIRFMWSQIVEGTSGCLLAHTMGLGKTMQVITLLVAIADAGHSSDKSVRDLVPKSFQNGRTLVLCPPGLIDNWMDELINWAPEASLGQLRKLDSTIRFRLDFIEDWYEDRGVLVMGYEMFRNLIGNAETTTRAAALNHKDHEKVKKYLLEGPSIVIADEAHKMKNSASLLAIAASGFDTSSKIALTGSPLANNVEEYHTMINWISPNYLGPIIEFRAKYAEPIQQGNYKDSTNEDRAQARKMLRVLMRDVEPKVHRKETSVLRHHLKPKLEFVIFVPLTNIQKEAYTIYVHSMLESDYETSKDGKVKQATLWHWLAVLSLLCNHPQCFKNKLQERKDDAKQRNTNKKKQPLLVDEESEDLLQEPGWKLGVSEALVEKIMTLFDKMEDIGQFNLSHKVAILLQILDASRAAKDKVLIFSTSIPTLDYLQELCSHTGRTWTRLDGKTKITQRQSDTKSFNTDNTEIYLISTTAGGLGLNLQAANRVIIFDFRWNPIAEEQAIGRAYRMGQQKPVYVYRFVAGGTFEDKIHNSSVFKTQLASKVVDKKNPLAWATKKGGDYLFEPKDVPQENLQNFLGRDPQVLDGIIRSEALMDDSSKSIRKVVLTSAFEEHDDVTLTAEEEADAQHLYSLEQLKRSNPSLYASQLQQERISLAQRYMAKPPLHGRDSASATYLAHPVRPSNSVLNIQTFQNGAAGHLTDALSRPSHSSVAAPSSLGPRNVSTTATKFHSANGGAEPTFGGNTKTFDYPGNANNTIAAMKIAARTPAHRGGRSIVVPRPQSTSQDPVGLPLARYIQPPPRSIVGAAEATTADVTKVLGTARHASNEAQTLHKKDSAQKDRLPGTALNNDYSHGRDNIVETSDMLMQGKSTSGDPLPVDWPVTRKPATTEGAATFLDKVRARREQNPGRVKTPGSQKSSSLPLGDGNRNNLPQWAKQQISKAHSHGQPGRRGSRASSTVSSSMKSKDIIEIADDD